MCRSLNLSCRTRIRCLNYQYRDCSSPSLYRTCLLMISTEGLFAATRQQSQKEKHRWRLSPQFHVPAITTNDECQESPIVTVKTRDFEDHMHFFQVSAVKLPRFSSTPSRLQVIQRTTHKNLDERASQTSKGKGQVLVDASFSIYLKNFSGFNKIYFSKDTSA